MHFAKLTTLLSLHLIFVSNSMAQVFPIYRNNGNINLIKAQNYLQSNQQLARLNKKIDSLGPEIDRLSTIQSTDSTNFKRNLIHLVPEFQIAEGTALSIQSIMDNIRSSVKNDKDSLNLGTLKQFLRNTPASDSINLEKINNKIESIKAFNLMEFLTTDKPPRAFWVTQSGNYNIDSLNKYIYNQNRLDVLQTAALQNFSNSNIITAELGSFLAGPLRVGAGGSFTTKADTAKNNAIKKSLQQIISNGGEFNLTLSAPLLYYRSRRDNFHFGVFAQSNFGVNPGFDSTTKTTDFSNSILFNNQSGFNIHFDLGASNGKGGLYIDFPLYYVWGNNNTYEKLLLSDFSVLKMQAGLQIAGLINFRVSGSLLSSSRAISKLPYIVSIQFSPSQIAKSSN